MKEEQVNNDKDDIEEIETNKKVRSTKVHIS